MTPSKILRSLVGLALVGLVTGQASATPNFALQISTGGVSRLAVGEVLQLRAYPPRVTWRHGEPPAPVVAPLRWSVKPADAATVDAQGRLTAKRPAEVVIHVEDARDLGPDELPAGLPGYHRLHLVKELDGGRLPRLDGLAALERFEVEWDARTAGGKPRLRVWLSVLRWRMWMVTPVLSSAPGPFPWTFEAVGPESGFNDDGYRDLLGPGDYERYRENLAKAKLTITGWKHHVVRGRFELSTRRGVKESLTFAAWLPDPHGLLAKATAAR